MRGFSFNGQHSYVDFKLPMDSKKISPPAKKKIKVSVPFMNGSYDFSTIGTNGEQIYNERQIQVILGLPTKSKENLHILYSKLLEWLEDVGRQQLIFDDIRDFYFLAEVEGASSFDEMMRFGKLTVNFTCQPFKMGVSEEGSFQLWDTFNFETDVMQESEFDVIENKTINLINVGRIACPTINVDAIMSIIVNSVTYNLGIGTNTIYGFKLQPGNNTIVITGTGHIQFIFRKQVL